MPIDKWMTALAAWVKQRSGMTAGSSPAGGDGTARIEPLGLAWADSGNEGLARKQRSEAVLRAAGIAINEYLPPIETEDEIVVRSPKEIGERLLALNIVAVKGEGLPQDVIERIIKERRMRALFTPMELAFIDDPHPSGNDRLQFMWRYDAAWVLFWALNFVHGPLGLPTEPCDVPLLAGTVRNTLNLTANGVRPTRQLLDEADLIYRCHWAVRQAGLDGVTAYGKLDFDVTPERHYALNWLIDPDGTDWDDIDTST